LKKSKIMRKTILLIGLVLLAGFAFPQANKKIFGNLTVTQTVIVDTIDENSPGVGVIVDGVTIKDGGALSITGGTNTFNLTNGTASLDVAAGITAAINSNLTVEASGAPSLIDQDLTQDASPTFSNLALSSILAGSILISVDDGGGGTILGQDNANLFWDDVNNRLGIGTTAPNTTLDVRGVGGTVVGGFFSGALHVTSPSFDPNANAVITGHNSNGGGNKQLWYLGSTSSLNDNITLINRQNGDITFFTNNLERLKITAAGLVQTDNLQLDGNTISVTDLNDTLILDAFAAGTGVVKVTDQLIIEGSTSQLQLTDTDNAKTYILKSNLGDFSIVEVGGNNVFKILGGAAVNSLQITANQVEIGTRLDVDNLRLDANTIASTDVNGNINLSPNGTGNVTNTNFTKLGSDAPVIKMKKLTGTTGATEGSTIDIAHGLTLAKIIGFDVLVTADNSNLIPMSFVSVSEFQFDSFIDPTNVRITMSTANSGNLLSNAVTVLLTYEE